MSAQTPSDGSVAPLPRDQRMAWWREARFGMFVHWGLYSAAAGEFEGKTLKKGNCEWIQKRLNIPADKYEKKLLPKFNPKEGFATQWASAAKEAGCKYIVFTSKHHEGFALHDSKLSTFDAMDHTGRDLFKEIVEATREEGLKVGVYHSLIDWHHPDAYVGMGLPDVKGTTNEGRDNAKYVDFLHGQTKEIVSNYGPIDILWWDYSKGKAQGEAWRAKQLMAMVWKHQPQLVMNNRLYRTSAHPVSSNPSLLRQWNASHGDFTTPEQNIPSIGIPGVDWETCMTMNGTWGYSKFDNRWKSSQKLIHNLVDIVSKGGNYLLNVGPKADGTIPQPCLQTLKEIGDWLEINGEAIYGTSASPFEKPSWGRYTCKPGHLYAHVFKWPKNQQLVIPLAGKEVSRACLLSNKEVDLSIKITGKNIVVTVPEQMPPSPTTVIAVDYTDQH